MRACFLGQNVTALGFGVALLQTPPLPEPEKPRAVRDEGRAEPARPEPENVPAPKPS